MQVGYVEFEKNTVTFYSKQNQYICLANSSCIVSLKIDENRYKQKISTDPYFWCYSYAVFTTKFKILYVTQRIMFESCNPKLT